MSQSLDFTGIKNELKEYLKSQPEFTDYNFEGSNLSLLLDILSYNAHYNAIYANLISNERFLDSAIKRANIVSLAKHLGYIPQSKKGAEAIINATVTLVGESLPTSFNLARYTKFNGRKAGSNTVYPFVLTTPLTAFASDGVFEFADLRLKQGQVAEWVFTVESPDQKFKIPSDSIDVNTLDVRVRESGVTSVYDIFVQGNYFRNYTPESKIFFVEETNDGFYEIYFSDGVIGKPLEVGNRLTIQYLDTKGTEGNDCSYFTPVGIGNMTVSTVARAAGGSDRESEEAIKFNAPRFYSSQGRAITTEDYKSIILSEIPQVQSIIVWGGEEMDPPLYSRVFVCLKQEGSTVVSQVVKDQVMNILKDRGMISFNPIIVDPDYIYIGITITSEYDSTKVTARRTIVDIIQNATEEYFEANLQKFDESFQYSKFLTTIDNSSEAILNTLIKLTIQKRVLPAPNVEFFFENMVNPNTLTTNNFYYRTDDYTVLGNIKDDGNGQLVFEGEGKSAVLGTINYDTGKGNLTLIGFAGFDPNYLFPWLKITADVNDLSRNIEASKNQILVIDDSVANISTNEKQGLRIIAKESSLA